MFEKIFKNVKIKAPLVHCMTNYVTANDVANSLLAIDASPLMADAIEEMEDMGQISDALVLNLGTLNTRMVESMLLSAKTKNKRKQPVILDPVGVGASKFRLATTMHLLDTIKFSVIRGNASEIKTIAKQLMTSKGVDVNKEDLINEESLTGYIQIAKEVSQKNQTIVIITGFVDIITDGKKVYLIKNGHSDMEKVSGTGCILAGLVGAVVGANPEKELEAAAVATAMMGIAGEKACHTVRQNKLGTASLRTQIIDELSLLTWEKFKEAVKLDVI